jgi:hypothetical protein
MPDRELTAVSFNCSAIFADPLKFSSSLKLRVITEHLLCDFDRTRFGEPESLPFKVRTQKSAASDRALKF